MTAFAMPGAVELIIILVVLLLLFGAKRLPEIARSVGKSSKEFKRGLREIEGDDDDLGDDEEARSRASDDGAARE